MELQPTKEKVQVLKGLLSNSNFRWHEDYSVDLQLDISELKLSRNNSIPQLSGKKKFNAVVTCKNETILATIKEYLGEEGNGAIFRVIGMKNF